MQEFGSPVSAALKLPPSWQTKKEFFDVADNTQQSLLQGPVRRQLRSSRRRRKASPLSQGSDRRSHVIGIGGDQAMNLATTINDRILAGHAAEIRKLGKRVVGDVIEIGKILGEAKRIAGHGNFGPWLKREFDWTEMTATRFMNVYEMSKSNNLLDLDLPVSSLYLLAAPSTPQEARDAIIERAEAGEAVSVAEVKDTIDAAKGRKRSKSKRPKTEPTESDLEAWAAGEISMAEAAKAGIVEAQQLLAKKAAIEPPTTPAAGDDIGESSNALLRVRVNELEAEVRQRDLTIAGLRRRIAELEHAAATGAPPPPGEDDDGIPDFLRRMSTARNKRGEIQ
jgi:Protein of unknown function (DUF3102)